MPNEGHRKPKSDERREKEREYARQYYWAHREERLRYAREDNPAHKRDRLRKSRAKLRDEIHAAYGNVCSCCGETNPKFLTIEHRNGGGREHRRQFGIGGLGVLYDIKKRGFPPEFTLLCFNCNCGQARNGGVCPHKEE
jgi:hypothetical protein